MTNEFDWEERREPWKKREDDARTAYEVDLARMKHSSSFRRLGAITQVISGEGSLHRTRLTHSTEVEQIAEGIVQRFRLLDPDQVPTPLRTHLEDNSMIRTVALCHDLGHPPFGHAGEEALNCMMRDRGSPDRAIADTDYALTNDDDCVKTARPATHTHGFEGNGQTLRILARLEDFSENAGANFTRRTLLGILKYPVAYSHALKTPVPGPLMTETGVPMITDDHAPPKCYLDTERDVVSWLLRALPEHEARLVVETRAKSIDASLMDRSDDLAYSFADLQDAVSLDLIKREHLMEDVPAAMWEEYIEYSAQRGSDDMFGDVTGYEDLIASFFSSTRSLQRQIGRLMGYGLARTRIRERPQFTDPLYAWEIDIAPNALALIEAIKSSILERVINSPKLQHGRLNGQMALIRLFDVMRTDPRHQLPEKQYRRYVQSGMDDRVICDWLAGASEQFVTKMHARIFTAGAASVTDRL